MSSATKAELGALYINGRKAIPAFHTLTKMGHPQPATPVQTDYTMGIGVVNNTIAPRRMKSMDIDILGKTSCILEHVRTYTYLDPDIYNRIQDSHVMAQTSA